MAVVRLVQDEPYFTFHFCTWYKMNVDLIFQGHAAEVGVLAPYATY